MTYCRCTRVKLSKATRYRKLTAGTIVTVGVLLIYYILCQNSENYQSSARRLTRGLNHGCYGMVESIATVVITTHHQEDFDIIKYLEVLDQNLQSIRDVILVCNGQKKCLPDLFLSCLSVTELSFLENKLTNRFNIADYVQTPAVLHLDGDMFIHPHDLDSMVDIWLGNRASMVGAFPGEMNQTGYKSYDKSSESRINFGIHGFNALLTGALILPRDILLHYMSARFEVERNHVDNVMNCEDLLVNFVHTDMFPAKQQNRPHIVAIQVSKWESNRPLKNVPQLHGRADHYSTRSDCVRLFSRQWSMPDRSFAFRNAPISVSKVFPGMHFVPHFSLPFPAIDEDPFVSPPSFGASKVRVFALMDEFTWKEFRNEWTILQPNWHLWRKEFDSFLPHFVFLESAWMVGKDWNRMFHQNDPDHFHLLDLVKHAENANIPVVFWNKEDPLSFDYFIRSPIMSHVNILLTTWFEGVQEYKLRRSSPAVTVDYLLFSGAPALHVPFTKTLLNLSASFCFVGSYNYNKYKFPWRHLELEKLLEPAADLKDLVIFDRQKQGSEDISSTSLPFPEKYQPFVYKSMPYDRIMDAYHVCPLHININTVNTSRTMFARRVFHLLLSGKVVLSNPHKGLSSIIGEDIYYPCNTRECSQKVMKDRILKEFLHRRAWGWKLVSNSHTTRHRADHVNYLVQKLGKPKAQAKRWFSCATIGSVCKATECQCKNAMRTTDVDVWFFHTKSVEVDENDLFAPLLIPGYVSVAAAKGEDSGFVEVVGLPDRSYSDIAVVSWLVSEAGLSLRSGVSKERASMHLGNLFNSSLELRKKHIVRTAVIYNPKDLREKRHLESLKSVTKQRRGVR